MPLSGDYATLQNEMQSWMGRQDSLISGRFPTLLTGAEQRIYYGFGEDDDPLRSRPLRTQLQEVLGATIAVTNGVGPLPADFLESRALWIPSSNTVQPDFETPQRFEAITNLMPWSDPISFTIVGLQVLVNAAWTGTLNLNYYKQFPAMASGPPNNSNALSLAFPMVWLFALLAEAFDFSRNAGESAKYQAKLKAGVAAINTASRKAVQAGPSQRALRLDVLQQPIRTLPVYGAAWVP